MLKREDLYLDEEQIEIFCNRWGMAILPKDKAHTLPLALTKSASDHTLKVIVGWLKEPAIMIDSGMPYLQFHKIFMERLEKLAGLDKNI